MRRTESSSEPLVVVSIHDVTPAHEGRIGRIYDLFSELRIERYALLVVPDYHGAWRLDKHPRFTEELRRRQDAGAEIFLHGLRHDEVGLRRSLGQELIAAGRTDREGEFLSLLPTEAARRIDAGLEMLRACGLHPVGFIPPAWLFGRDLVQIIGQRKLPITEGIIAITDSDSGRRLIAPALAWDTRARWLSAALAVLAAFRCRVEIRRRIVRVAVHPPDIDDPNAGPSLRATLRTLLETREAVSYRMALGAGVVASQVDSSAHSRARSR